MKIVINRCYGGWSLSAKAALWLHKKGLRDPQFMFEVHDYYGTDESLEADLKRWREGAENGRWFTIFTPDEKHVLSTHCRDLRAHPLVVECVETLGKKANGQFAKLEVIEIPDGIKWEIDEYDGIETVHEEHRSWP